MITALFVFSGCSVPVTQAPEPDSSPSSDTSEATEQTTTEKPEEPTATTAATVEADPEDTTAPEAPPEDTDTTEETTVSPEETDIMEEEPGSPDETAPKPEPPADIEGINNETFLKYTGICDKYKPAEGNNAEYIYLYNFNTSMSTGFGVDGTVIHTESDYGIRGSVEDGTMYITVYDHTGTKSLTAVYMQGLDASNARDNVIYQITTEKAVKFDTSTLKNGLYRVIAKFTNGNVIALYFYVNGEDILFCEEESLTENIEARYENRRAELMRILADGDVTPENSLSLENIWYPFREFNSNYRCDTQRWIELSNTVITDDSWSDEHKLYVLQAWIRENIAYDEFSRDQEKSRAQYYGDYSGKYSVYDLRAGICFDYANIVAIMCRAHGIPAVTISSDKARHEWNAVYVNNRWMEFDACMSEQYHVGENTSVRTKTTDGIYDGAFSVMVWGGDTYEFPSDAAANQDFQQDSNYIY